MNTLIISDEFDAWLDKLRDMEGKARILKKMKQIRYGNFGDAKSLGGGIFEIKVHMGPGYRIYYTRRGDTIYLLLNGGDKSTQSRDIKQAKTILNRMREE